MANAEIRRRESEPGEVRAAYGRWSRLLLELATARLDRQARVYLAMRRHGTPIKDIAAVLGVSEKTLWNKFGGDRLAELVRQVVRQMVLALPSRHRLLLARHLLEEAGLTAAQARRLLGVAVQANASVPVMEEDALLAELGWLPEKIKDVGSPLGAAGVCLENTRRCDWAGLGNQSLTAYA